LCLLSALNAVALGSKPENLIASKCLPLFSQQRTFGSAFSDLLGGC
jgi:hypothetical protein